MCVWNKHEEHPCALDPWIFNLIHLYDKMSPAEGFRCIWMSTRERRYISMSWPPGPWNPRLQDPLHNKIQHTVKTQWANDPNLPEGRGKTPHLERCRCFAHFFTGEQYLIKSFFQFSLPGLLLPFTAGNWGSEIYHRGCWKSSLCFDLMLSACLGSQEATADWTQPEGKLCWNLIGSINPQMMILVLKLQCWRLESIGDFSPPFRESFGSTGEYLAGDCSDQRRIPLAAGDLFAIHTFSLKNSRTLQVDYSTTSKPPVYQCQNLGW